MPNFLDEKHSIATAADAEAYLARLDGFATVLDQNTDRFRHDAGKGVIPPDFLLDITLGQLAALRTTGDKSDLVKSLDRRARAKGLGEAYGAKAAQLYDAKVGPALDRQIAALKQAPPGPVHQAGRWPLQGGPRAAGDPGRLAAGLFRKRAARPLAARGHLFQPQGHGRVAEVEPALDPLSRGPAGPSAAGRPGAGKPGHPDAAQEHVLFGLRRRMGALCRATGPGTRHVR